MQLLNGERLLVVGPNAFGDGAGPESLRGQSLRHTKGCAIYRTCVAARTPRALPATRASQLLCSLADCGGRYRLSTARMNLSGSALQTALDCLCQRIDVLGNAFQVTADQRVHHDPRRELLPLA